MRLALVCSITLACVAPVIAQSPQAAQSPCRARDAQERHTSIGKARFSHPGSCAGNTGGDAGGGLRSTPSRRGKRLQDRHHACSARQHDRTAGAGKLRSLHATSLQSTMHDFWLPLK